MIRFTAPADFDSFGKLENAESSQVTHFTPLEIMSVGTKVRIVTKTNTVILEDYDVFVDALNNPLGNNAPEVAAAIAAAFHGQNLMTGLDFKGTWNAATNTPTIPMASSNNKNWFYICTVAGVYNSQQYNVGDWILSTGTEWRFVDNSDAVPPGVNAGDILTWNGTTAWISSAFEFKRSGLGATTTPFRLHNDTPATAGVPVQVSPAISWKGSVWNGTTNVTVYFRMYLAPIASTNPSRLVVLESSPDEVSWVQVASFSGGGISGVGIAATLGVFNTAQITTMFPSSDADIRIGTRLNTGKRIKFGANNISSPVDWVEFFEGKLKLLSFALLNTLENGTFENLAPHMYFTTGSKRGFLAKTIFAQRDTKIIENITTPTSQFSDINAIGSRTLAANTLAVGDTFEIEIDNIINSVGNPSNTLAVQIGGNTIITSTAAIGANTNEASRLRLKIKILSIGVNGTAIATGMTDLAGATSIHRGLVNPSFTINTTVANTIDVLYTWGAANASNTLRTVCARIIQTA